MTESMIELVITDIKDKTNTKLQFLAAILI